MHNTTYERQPPDPDAGRCIEKESLSRNVALLGDLFGPDHQDNIDNLLCGSSLFEKGGTLTMKSYTTDDKRQASAKLHLLYGVSLDLAGTEHATHPFARSRVYDLRNYTEKTCWGPFSRDGKMNIDWECLEVVFVILAYNFRIFRRRTNGAVSEMWNKPFAGVAPDAWPIIHQPKLPMEDPYGCYGTWMRVS